MSQTIQHSVRFTREDLDRMVEAGVFANRKERIELLAGELQMVSPASSEHDDVIRYLIRWSQKCVGDRFFLGVQQGLRLLKSESQPEPDFYWIEASHQRGRPTSSVVPLVIEVAGSSLEKDMILKRTLYAQDQIQEHWVANIVTETIVVHRQPNSQNYQVVETYRIGQSIAPQCLSDATLDLKWLFRG